MSIRYPILTACAAFAAAACSGSNATVAPVVPALSSPAAASTVISGDSDALAAELLLAGDRSTPLSWHPRQQPVADAALATAIDDMALDHIRSTVLGASTGPSLLGSNAVRNLAAAPNAPVDQNQQNGNLDETLAAETARILTFAPSPPPATAALPMLPWRTRSAELAAPLPAGGNANEAWQTRELGDHAVEIDQVAHFVRMRAAAARRLLRERRPGVYGIDPDQGALGLLAMQQVLAAEDTLFSAVFTSGGALGPLDNPSAYDPTTNPRWLPRAVLVDLDPAIANAPSSIRPLDSASDLRTLGTVLHTSSELGAMARPTAPLALAELFRNTPFDPPPVVTAPPSISWQRDIGPLLAFRCGFCHLQQTFGGFSIRSYELMRDGGNKTRAFNLDFIIEGDAQESLLYKILTGPPSPFVQMPFAGAITAPELALITDWINSGALNLPLAPPSPPRPGDDLALVSFRNLAALHFDATTGALHHRFEGDGSSGVATTIGTGRALFGLAEFAQDKPIEEFAGQTSIAILDLAATYAAIRMLDAEGRAFDAIDIATGTATGTADLRSQAAMTAGLLAAAAQLPSGHPANAAAIAATTFLVTGFGDDEGNFGNFAGQTASSYTAATLTEVLAALRLAASAGIPGAAEGRTRLLTRLRPALAFSEWEGHGEVFDDGIADTDGNGLREPGAAGDGLGRLPVLADRIIVDPGASVRRRAPTWTQDVRPLLLQKCGECHMNGNENGEYRLDTLRSLATPGESEGQFPMLVPGAAEESFFFQKLSRRQPALGTQMPQTRTPMDAFSIALIREWIDAGATPR